MRFQPGLLRLCWKGVQHLLLSKCVCFPAEVARHLEQRPFRIRRVSQVFLIFHITLQALPDRDMLASALTPAARLPYDKCIWQASTRRGVQLTSILPSWRMMLCTSVGPNSATALFILSFRESASQGPYLDAPTTCLPRGR